jgi:hypothetical protein
MSGAGVQSHLVVESSTTVRDTISNVELTFKV